MGPAKDDDRALAEIERALKRDDPELVLRLSELSNRIAQERAPGRRIRARWLVITVVPVVILFLALLIVTLSN